MTEAEPGDDDAMDENMNHATVSVDKQSRMVIPAALRYALSIEPGEELIARVNNGQLVIEKPGAILDRLQTWFATVPAEVSLVDALIAERHQEARRDNAE
jgi:AbrB family looped-hinge helix DNA binding protein